MPYQITDEMRAFRKRSNRTYLFTMDPRDFLRLTTHEDLLSMDEVLKDAKPLAFYNSLSANDPDTYNGDIYFDIELNSTGTVGKVFNHEGRHRCGALINAGEQTVEVSARFVKVDHENYDVKTITPKKPIKKIISQFAKGFNAPPDKTVMMSAIRVSRARRKLLRRNPSTDARLQGILRATRQEPTEDNFRFLINEARRQGQYVLVLTTNERTHKRGTPEEATYALTHVETNHVVHLVRADLSAKLTNPRRRTGLDVLGRPSWNYAGSFHPKLLTILSIKTVPTEYLEQDSTSHSIFERHCAASALAVFGLNEYGEPGGTTKRLLRRRNPARRKALFVDLDETLVHTNFERGSGYKDSMLRPGAHSLLQTARGLFDEINILTMGRRETQLKVLQHHNLLHYFDNVYGKAEINEVINDETELFSSPDNYAVLIDDNNAYGSPGWQHKMVSIGALDWDTIDFDLQARDAIAAKHFIHATPWLGDPSDTYLSQVEQQLLALSRARNPDEPRGVPEHIYFKKGSKTVCTSAVLAAFGIDACSYHYSGKLQQRLNILRKNGYAARSRNSHIARGYKKLRLKRGEKSVGQVRRIIARLNKDNPETNAWGDPPGTRYMIRVLGHALLLDYHGNTIVDTDPRIRDKRKVLDLRAVFRKPEIESSRRYLRRRNPASLEKLEKIAKARMLYAQQDEKNISEIAEELDVGWNTVQKWIQDIAEPSKSVFIADVEDEVERLYNLGDKNSGDATIARAVGVNRATIARWRKKRGLPPGKNWKIDQRVRELYAEHGNIGTVGKILGISPSTVYNKVKDLAKKKKRTDRKQQLYDQGFTDRQIADEMGLSKTTIASWRHVRNLPPNDPPLEEWEENIAELQAEAARLYKELGSAKKVAKQLGVSYHHVKKWLRDIEYVDPRVAEVKRIYRETGNFREITRRTGVGYRTAKRWVTPRRYLRRRNPDLETLEQIAEARKLYQQGIGVEKLSQRFKKNYYTVRSWVEDLIPPKVKGPSRERKIDREHWKQRAREIYADVRNLGATKRRIDKELWDSVDVKQGIGVPTIRKWVSDLVEMAGPKKARFVPTHLDPRQQQAKDLFQGCDPAVLAARGPRSGKPSFKKIAAKLGLNQMTISKWYKKGVLGLDPDCKEKPLEDPRMMLRLALYHKGLTDRELAESEGTSRRVIAAWRRHRGLPINKIIRRNPEDLETLELIAEARKLYTDNQHIARTAHILGVSQQKVKQWVQDLRPHTGRWADLSEEQARAKQLYQDCDESIMSRGRVSKNKLGQAVGVSLPTIKKWINAGELGPDPGCDIEARFLSLYNLGHTDTEIANQLGVSRNQIKLVRHAKLQLPPNRMSDRYAEGLVRGMSSRVIANWIKETWGTDVKPQAILKWKSKQRQRRP